MPILEIPVSFQCVHVAGTAVKPGRHISYASFGSTTTLAGGTLEAGAFLPSFAPLGNRSLWLNHFHSRAAGNHIDNIACPLYESLLKLQTRLASTWQLLLQRRMQAATKTRSLPFAWCCSYENQSALPATKHQSLCASFSSMPQISNLTLD